MFDAIIVGLDDARKAISEQMLCLLSEVERFTKDPSQLQPGCDEPYI